MVDDLRVQLQLLAAKQIVAEAVITEVLVPLLAGLKPELSRELIHELRHGFTIRSHGQGEQLQLMTEEYLQQLADKIEGRVRMRQGDQ